MKTFIAILIIVSCTFIGNVEGVSQQNRINAINQTMAQIENNERSILLKNCTEIQAIVSEHFIATGSVRGSGHRNAIKREITNYLNSVGTATARQLLNELQANGFQNFMY